MVLYLLHLAVAKELLPWLKRKAMMSLVFYQNNTVHNGMHNSPEQVI